MPETDSSSTMLNAISEDVRKRKDLEFFKTYLLRLEALRHHFDAEITQQIVLMEEALSIAKKHDEQIVIADLQTGFANVVKHFDIERAIDLLKTSSSVSEQLGYRHNLSHVHQEMGHIAGIRGEYDSAIECLLESWRVRESLKLPVRTTRYLLATYYNLSRNGKAALRIIDEAISAYESVRKLSPYALIQRAWALTNLGRYSIARDELETAKGAALKTGIVWNASIWPNLVEGLLEKAEGNHDRAIALFEDILKDFNDKPIPFIRNVCYLSLAEIEIERNNLESLDRPDGASGPWMDRLQEYVECNQLPGIQAQMLLLKARIYQKYGQNDKARALIHECHQLAELSGLMYLRHMINQQQLSLETKIK